MIHATKLLSDFIADLHYEDIPFAAVEATKKYLIDYYSANAAAGDYKVRFAE